MAAQKFGRLIFRGILTVRLEQAPERIGVVPGPAQQATWTLPFRYGTTATPIDTLKIDAPQIRFKCNVTARGTGNVDDWESGILQSISHASWVAQYLNGAQLKYRLDTDHGLVRDGGPGHPLFFREGHSFNAVALPEVYESSWVEPDGPQVTFLTEFAGDPFNAHAPPTDDLRRLSRTEGKVKLHAFLAVVNRITASILTLAESHWTLNWDGSYDFTNKSWTPNDADDIIIHKETDIAQTYQDPNNAAVSLPFSLDTAVANERTEVWTSDGWRPCREGLPVQVDRKS